MRMSSLITTLNPAAETTNPARPIQSLTLIVTGSSARITEKGRATFILFPCDTSVCTGRDLRARAVPLRSAISGPPISQTDSAAEPSHRPTAPWRTAALFVNRISDGNGDSHQQRGAAIDNQLLSRI